jgi:hypothetical protein
MKGRRRGRPLGDEPATKIGVDFGDEGLAVELHTYCRSNDFERSDVVEDALREYFDRRRDFVKLTISIAATANDDLVDFCAASWRSDPGNVVAEALSEFIPNALSKNDGIRAKFAEIRREKRTLPFRK